MDESPLTYEETPIINPSTGQSTQATLVAKPPKQNIFQTLGFIVFLIIIFGVGIWLSSFLRNYIPSFSAPLSLPLVSPAIIPSPTSAAKELPTDPFFGWKEYQVLNALTRKNVPGVSFKLPPDFLGPLCDGASCASQGTYLPGGTRFTVAARGSGQYLTDFRGKIITDVSGREFIAKDTTIAGHPAVEFSGDFSGTTIGGYVFSKMHGYMIIVTPTLSLEINHFTPSLVSADFLKDDILLGRILETLVLPELSVTPTPLSKGGASPVTPTPTSANP